MPVPLLSTKLHFPPARSGLVGRPRLVERLEQGLGGPLTLISAPAGSGKSTLLSAWRAGSGKGYPAAWFSLDTDDNDPSRFLAYLVAALETLQAGIASGTGFLLQSPQAEPVESVLTSLINDLSAYPSDFALILDDYHVLTSPVVQAGMTFLLEHMPPQMHLVILTRADPPFPLARLRGHGQMVEIRAADLRFTRLEANEFLNHVMGLSLPEADISALYARIEGWAAGFQLVGVALQSRLEGQGAEDAHQFVSAFTGSHHYIVEYLVEEVLNQQAETVQDFLLKTSILDRFTASLCEGVLRDMGQGLGEGGMPVSPTAYSPALILEYLEKANLFLLPLDEEHTWFRYHPLFADVLRGRLKQLHPGLLAALHRRAAEWYGGNGLFSDAIQQALAAGDRNFAADLVEQTGWETMLRGEWSILADWIRAVEDQVKHKPVLGLIQAWSLTTTGQGGVVEGKLEKVEQELENETHLDEAARAVFLGRAASLRGLLAYYRGDAPAAVNLSRKALEGFKEDNWIDRSIAAHILGESSNRCNDLAGAIRANQEAARLAKLTGGLTLGISAMTALGDLQMAQGNLQAALNEYEEALRFVTTPGGRLLLPAGRVKVCLSKIYYEWNDLQAAGKAVQECLELCRKGGDLEYLIIGFVNEARLKRSLGDLEGADRAMQEALKLTSEHKVPATTISLVESFRARLLLEQDLQRALRWAEQSDLKTTGELSFIREWEYRSLVRILAAGGEVAASLALLSRLSESAEQAGRWGWVIHYAVAQAVILEGAGKSQSAQPALEKALRLGRPANYRRVFLDEGAPVAKMLVKIRETGQKMEEDGSLIAYLDGLLSDFGMRDRVGLDAEKGARLEQPGLIEPLSDRELEVLRLVADGMTNQEVAAELFLAVGTIKRHLNNIFGKLGVKNRTECVARARIVRLI